MDWLIQLTQQTAVIVPTRSLANSLQEQIAAHHLSNDQSVWEAPTILVWQDYIQHLWLANRDNVSQAYQVISAQQSLLLWHKVVDASRRQESEFTLLDVQQTAQAMQRSWRLMHDWRLDIDTLKLDHAADTQQFITWFETYQALLTQRAYLDNALLADTLLNIDLNVPFTELIWYAYDLKTAQQQQFDHLAQSKGTVIRNITTASQTPSPDQPVRHFIQFDTKQQELREVLLSIRQLIEADPSVRINLVIPDLQHSQTQVRQLAKDVFYPSSTPLEVQSNPKAYRFSLGEPLSQWPAIEAAIRVLKLLKNHNSLTDISLLLRSEYVRIYRQQPQACLQFVRWLQGQRILNLSIETLQAQLLRYQQQYEDCDVSALVQWLAQVVEQRQQLQQQLSQSQYSTLSFVEWADVFVQWLTVWGWGKGALNSVQFQLFERWASLLDEYRGLSFVQPSVGLNRALDILTQMARDAVFLPKAPASPLLISGLYEAIGQTADHCFLLGMDDHYPAPVKADAFIPSRLLLAQGYPEASNVSSFEQAQGVIQSLLNGAQTAHISYAKFADHNEQIARNVSAIFRQQTFVASPENTHTQSVLVALEAYQDTQGKPWPSAKQAKGGAKIFEDQSNCAFKAFITHQLTFRRHDEAEFGLDALDRGNIAHLILQKAWQHLQLQSELLNMDELSLTQFCQQIVATVIAENAQQLSDDKLRLLAYEQIRLSSLLKEWLAVDAQRPMPFAVLETEERRNGEYGGIRFQYIIDRLDSLDDGRTLIIDYKTGLAERADWSGERIKKPQLPLYSLALQSAKQNAVSGIAYGKIKRHDSAYIALSDAGVFKKSSHYETKIEQQWQDSQQRWPSLFDQLAADFLAGKALMTSQRANRLYKPINLLLCKPLLVLAKRVYWCIVC